MAALIERDGAAGGELRRRCGEPAAERHGTRRAQPRRPIGIEDFAKLDLRVARVVAAAAVEGSDKLLG